MIEVILIIMEGFVLIFFVRNYMTHLRHVKSAYTTACFILVFICVFQHMILRTAVLVMIETENSYVYFINNAYQFQPSTCLTLTIVMALISQLLIQLALFLNSARWIYMIIVFK